MAELPKFASINEGALMTEFKSQFNLLKTKKTVAIAYGFVSVFIAVTIFLAFSPSPNSASPWFSNIFSISSSRTSGISATTPSSAGSSDALYGSHMSSIFSYFFPNSSQQANSSTLQLPPTSIDRSQNSTTSGDSNFKKGSTIVNNQTHTEEYHDKVGVLKQN